MARYYGSPKFKSEFRKEAAKPHKKGANIMITLSAIDKRYGRYYYPMRTNIYYTLYKDTRRYYLRSLYLLRKVRNIELGDLQNARFVFDVNLLDDIFLTISKYLTNYYLLVEYFLAENLWLLNNANNNHKLGFKIDDNAEFSDRLKTLDLIIGDTNKLPNSVSIIMSERDFLMHPTFRRIFPTEKLQNWKENLVGWFLSGEIEGTFLELARYLHNKQGLITTYLDKLPKKTVSLTIQRGLVASEPSKKNK